MHASVANGGGGRTPRTAHALGLALLLAAAPPARAGDDPTVSGKELARLGFFQDFDELDLEALLATASATVSVASGRDEGQARAPAAVSIVSDTQIRDLGARTLEDVLRLLPGFDVLRDTLGQPRIVVRGGGLQGSAGGSEGVLLLLNGQRLNEAITGSASAVNLDFSLAHVRRIEIWRGSGSALYGPGAQRAVINVVTQSSRDFQGVQLAAEGGSFATQDYALRLASSWKGVSFSGLVEWADTHGPELLVPADRQTAYDAQLVAQGRAPISLAPAPSHDDRRTFQADYVVEYGNFSLQWHSLHEQTGAFVGFADTLGLGNDLSRQQTSLGLGYRKPLATGSVEARAAFTRSRGDQTLGAAPPGFSLPQPDGSEVRFPSGVYVQSQLNVDRYEGQALLERRAGAHALRGGLELASERTFDLAVRSNLDYITGAVLEDVQPLPGAVPESTRDSFGAFVQDAWSRSRASLTAGLRFDHLSDAGDFVSPRAALTVDLNGGLALRLLYARGFRPPSFQELYFDLPGWQGNPGLVAPRSDSLEGGLSYRVHDLVLSGHAFWNVERDPIQLLGPFDPRRQQPWTNAPDLHARGLELELERTFGLENSLFASYTFQHVEQDAPGGPVPAAGVPEQLVSAGVSLAPSRHLLVSPSLSWRASRPRAAGDARAPLPAYALVDLALRFRNLYRTLEVVALARNLFDRSYADPAEPGGLPQDYPRAGRSLRVQASYRF